MICHTFLLLCVQNQLSADIRIYGAARYVSIKKIPESSLWILVGDECISVYVRCWQLFVCFMQVRYQPKIVKRANFTSKFLMPASSNSTLIFAFSPVPSVPIKVPEPKRSCLIRIPGFNWSVLIDEFAFVVFAEHLFTRLNPKGGGTGATLLGK